MTDFIWLHNKQTDGYWQCPAGLVDELLASGQWERCDPPPEPNPATAEHAAWRENESAVTDAEPAAAEAETTKSTTRAARRGESTEE